MTAATTATARYSLPAIVLHWLIFALIAAGAALAFYMTDLPLSPLKLKYYSWLHGLLYVLLFAIPLSGWLYSSAAGVPTVYFGVIPLPDLLERDKALAETLKAIHEALNYTLFTLVAAHAGAALKHHFIDGDDVLARMLPFAKLRRN